MFNALLDTCALLYYLNGDDRIQSVKDRIGTDKDLYISIMTFWEIEIKHKKAKLILPQNVNFRRFVAAVTSCFSIINTTPDHIVTLSEDLESFEDHKDPFDRLIIATAIHEGLVLISSDSKFNRYSKLNVMIV